VAAASFSSPLLTANTQKALPTNSSRVGNRFWGGVGIGGDSAHMILGPDISTFVKKVLQENADISSLTRKGLPTIPTDASLIVDNIKFGAGMSGIKSLSIVENLFPCISSSTSVWNALTKSQLDDTVSRRESYKFRYYMNRLRIELESRDICYLWKYIETRGDDRVRAEYI
jgi:hypothetical protein